MFGLGLTWKYWIFYADVADNFVVSCCWLRLKFDIKVNVEVSVGVIVDVDVGLCHRVGVDWATKVKACNISTTKEYTWISCVGKLKRSR